MYYITKKTSETGKKFQKVSDNMDLAMEEAKVIAEKYGFHKFRGAYVAISGGISSCIDFDEAPDKKIWGKGARDDEFMPKRNSRQEKPLVTK